MKTQLARLARSLCLAFALGAGGVAQRPRLVAEDGLARLGPGFDLDLAAHTKSAQ